VFAAFLVAALILGGVTRSYWVLLLCAFVMWAVGTVDDRLAVPPLWRVVIEALAAGALFAANLGWNISGVGALNLLLTLVWVVGLVTAFNLMDNLDGACGTVAAVSAAGIGILAVIHHQRVLAGMACALSAACVAFLLWNLARPAKIFLGDGGSMPIGFLIAGLAMALSRHLGVGASSLLAAAMMVGTVILDTTLVTVSRTRRGVRLVTGGRDHLSHRLLRRLHSTRAVAGALAVIQGLLCALAIIGVQLGSAALVGIAAASVVAGLLAISVLDTPRWRGPGVAVGPHPEEAESRPGLEHLRVEHRGAVATRE
jgi:UDP-GlcNAc:undecaprenyl-phosphate GlcNAc-1-phosphate transferase